MCTNIKKTPVKEAICYKVVKVLNGKYYSWYAESSFLKNGKATKPRREGSIMFKNKVVGLITAYKNKRDAEYFSSIVSETPRLWHLGAVGETVLLKVKLSDIKYRAKCMDGSLIYIGSKILSIEEVK